MLLIYSVSYGVRPSLIRQRPVELPHRAEDLLGLADPRMIRKTILSSVTSSSPLPWRLEDKKYVRLS